VDHPDPFAAEPSSKQAVNFAVAIVDQEARQKTFAQLLSAGTFLIIQSAAGAADSGQNYSDGRAGQVTAPSCRERSSVSPEPGGALRMPLPVRVCPLTPDEFVAYSK
jgi:hypothetical protein